MWQLYQQPAGVYGFRLDRLRSTVLLMVIMFALTVPVWVSLGFTAIALLMATEVLPLSLFGEALFQGIDAFALIAIPLFILTGDCLVRTGLSARLLDVAEATMGSLRSGMGTSTVLGCGFFSCISGSDAAGAAAVGRMTVSRLVEKGLPLTLRLRPGGFGVVHRNPDSSVHCLHHHRTGARHFRLDTIPGRRRAGPDDHGFHHGDKRHLEPAAQL